MSDVKAEKECLRIVLDKEASQNYEKMADRLKAVGPYIKFYPSQFVSYLLSDFFQTYFEKDFDVLVARFFDSKSFLASEIQKAENPDQAATILKEVVATIDRIKSQSRGNSVVKTASKRGRKPKANAENTLPANDSP